MNDASNLYTCSRLVSTFQTEQQTLVCRLQLNIRDTLLLVGQFSSEEFALDANTALKFILY